jgi:hypothetical protein
MYILLTLLFTLPTFGISENVKSHTELGFLTIVGRSLLTTAVRLGFCIACRRDIIDSS